VDVDFSKLLYIKIENTLKPISLATAEGFCWVFQLPQNAYQGLAGIG
jgi:hypothetical protein